MWWLRIVRPLGRPLFESMMGLIFGLTGVIHEGGVVRSFHTATGVDRPQTLVYRSFQPVLWVREFVFHVSKHPVLRLRRYYTSVQTMLTREGGRGVEYTANTRDIRGHPLRAWRHSNRAQAFQ